MDSGDPVQSGDKVLRQHNKASHSLKPFSPSSLYYEFLKSMRSELGEPGDEGQPEEGDREGGGDEVRGEGVERGVSDPADVPLEMRDMSPTLQQYLLSLSTHPPQTVTPSLAVWRQLQAMAGTSCHPVIVT